MSEKEYIDIKRRCYNYSIRIIKLIDQIEIKRIFYSLIDQLLRSATSIGANLIEAKSAHSKKDFIKFYEIALKSANENKYWICLLRDGLELNKDELNNALREVTEISNIIASIILKLKDTKANVIKEQFIGYGYNELEF
uniref:Four helix bundle protein n=1 Tax=Ignavibacterium album TaxID=591197 RepID=A0A7V2ZKV1_9BACT